MIIINGHPTTKPPLHCTIPSTRRPPPYALPFVESDLLPRVIEREREREREREVLKLERKKLRENEKIEKRKKRC
jgi:hypothetical protein